MLILSLPENLESQLIAAGMAVDEPDPLQQQIEILEAVHLSLDRLGDCDLWLTR